MSALPTFYNHSARTRTRVDRYCCLISAALADRHFIFDLSAALAEPLGAGNFWPMMVLAAELATAAELPGRADRRPGSRFAACSPASVLSPMSGGGFGFFIH
jgi:hypothetical protein